MSVVEWNLVITVRAFWKVLTKYTFDNMLVIYQEHFPV